MSSYRQAEPGGGGREDSSGLQAAVTTTAAVTAAVTNQVPSFAAADLHAWAPLAEARLSFEGLRSQARQLPLPMQGHGRWPAAAQQPATMVQPWEQQVPASGLSASIDLAGSAGGAGWHPDATAAACGAAWAPSPQRTSAQQQPWEQGGHMSLLQELQGAFSPSPDASLPLGNGGGGSGGSNQQQQEQRDQPGAQLSGGYEGGEELPLPPPHQPPLPQQQRRPPECQAPPPTGLAESNGPLMLLWEWQGGSISEMQGQGEAHDAGERHQQHALLLAQQQQQQQQQQVMACTQRLPAIVVPAPETSPVVRQHGSTPSFAWQHDVPSTPTSPPAAAPLQLEPAGQVHSSCPSLAQLGGGPAGAPPPPPIVRRESYADLDWLAPTAYPSPIQPQMLPLPPPPPGGASLRGLAALPPPQQQGLPLSLVSPAAYGRQPKAGSYKPLPPRQCSATSGGATAVQQYCVVAYPPQQPWHGGVQMAAAAPSPPMQYYGGTSVLGEYHHHYPVDLSTAAAPRPAGPAVTAVSVAALPRWQQEQQLRQQLGGELEARKRKEGQAAGASGACGPSAEQTQQQGPRPGARTAPPLPCVLPAGSPAAAQQLAALAAAVPAAAVPSRATEPLQPAGAVGSTPPAGSSGGHTGCTSGSGSGGHTGGSGGRTGGTAGGTGGGAGGSNGPTMGQMVPQQLSPPQQHGPFMQMVPQSCHASPVCSPSQLLLLQQQQLQIQQLQQQMEQLRLQQQQQQQQQAAAAQQRAVQQAQAQQAAAGRKDGANGCGPGGGRRQSPGRNAGTAMGGLSQLFGNGPQFSDSLLFAGLSNMSLPTFVQQNGDELVRQAGEVVQSPRLRQAAAAVTEQAGTTAEAKCGAVVLSPAAAGAGQAACDMPPLRWGQPAQSVGSGEQRLPMQQHARSDSSRRLPSLDAQREQGAEQQRQRRQRWEEEVVYCEGSGDSSLQCAGPQPASAVPRRLQQLTATAAAAASPASGGRQAVPSPMAAHQQQRQAAAMAPPLALPEHQQRKLYKATTVAGRWAQKVVRADWADIQRRKHFEEAAATQAVTEAEAARADHHAEPAVGERAPRRASPIRAAAPPSSSSSSSQGDDGEEEEEQSISEWRMENETRRQWRLHRRQQPAAAVMPSVQRAKQLLQRRQQAQQEAVPRLQRLRGRPPSKDPAVAEAWRRHQEQAEAAAAAQRLCKQQRATGQWCKRQLKTPGKAAEAPEVVTAPPSPAAAAPPEAQAADDGQPLLRRSSRATKGVNPHLVSSEEQLELWVLAPGKEDEEESEATSEMDADSDADISDDHTEEQHWQKKQRVSLLQPHSATGGLPSLQVASRQTHFKVAQQVGGQGATVLQQLAVEEEEEEAAQLAAEAGEQPQQRAGQILFVSAGVPPIVQQRQQQEQPTEERARGQEARSAAPANGSPLPSWEGRRQQTVRRRPRSLFVDACAAAKAEQLQDQQPVTETASDTEQEETEEEGRPQAEPAELAAIRAAAARVAAEAFGALPPPAAPAPTRMGAMPAQPPSSCGKLRCAAAALGTDAAAASTQPSCGPAGGAASDGCGESDSMCHIGQLQGEEEATASMTVATAAAATVVATVAVVAGLQAVPAADAEPVADTTACEQQQEQEQEHGKGGKVAWPATRRQGRPLGRQPVARQKRRQAAAPPAAGRPAPDSDGAEGKAVRQSGRKRRAPWQVRLEEEEWEQQQGAQQQEQQLTKKRLGRPSKNRHPNAQAAAPAGLETKQKAAAQQPPAAAGISTAKPPMQQKQQQRQRELAEERAAQIQAYCHEPSPPPVGNTRSEVAAAAVENAPRQAAPPAAQVSPEVNSGGGGGGGELAGRAHPAPNGVALRLMINSGSLTPAVAAQAQAVAKGGRAAGAAAATQAAPVQPNEAPILEDVQSCILVARQPLHGSAAAAMLEGQQTWAQLQAAAGGDGGGMELPLAELLQCFIMQKEAELERERAEKEAMRRKLDALQQQTSSQEPPRRSEGTKRGPLQPPPQQQPVQAHRQPHSSQQHQHPSIQEMQQQANRQQPRASSRHQQPPSIGGGAEGGGGGGDATAVAFHTQAAILHTSNAVQLGIAEADLQREVRRMAVVEAAAMSAAPPQQQQQLPLDRAAGTTPERKRKQREGEQEEGVPAAAATDLPLQPQDSAGCRAHQQAGSGSVGSAASRQNADKRRHTPEPTTREPGQQFAKALSKSCAKADAGSVKSLVAATYAERRPPPGPARELAPAPAEEASVSGQTASASASGAAAAPEAHLPPGPGPQPQPPFPGCARIIRLEEWRQHKAELQQWERRKARLEAAETELAELAGSGGKRRRRRPGSPPPGVPPLHPPLLLPPPSAASLLLQQQHDALAAAQGGRSGPRRAAAVTGAVRLAAQQRGSCAAVEEVVPLVAVDMPSLRRSAPLIKQHKSAMHGWGMFAGMPIRRGAFVIEYTGEVVSDAVADRREREYEASGDGTMYFFRLDAQQVIDATHKGNAARYINHSCDPNCFTRVLLDMHTRLKSMAIFALRDILTDEELTYHYMIEEEPDAEPLPCNCGAAKCTGRMN